MFWSTGPEILVERETTEERCWPGYNENRGRNGDLPGEDWRPVQAAKWPKQREQAQGARLWVHVEFTHLSPSISEGEAAICIGVLYILCYAPFDLSACAPLFKYNHALINNVGSFKKKTKKLCDIHSDLSFSPLSMKWKWKSFMVYILKGRL